MAKKCIPGVICIENMTLFLLIIIIILIVYLYYNYLKTIHSVQVSENKVNEKIVLLPQQPLVGLATRNNPFTDPYSPPLKMNGMYFPPDSGDIRGIPINVPTRGFETNYQQVGILTPTQGHNQGQMILPLMGRQIMNGRDKWQYYTISNSGNLNTKLPISLNGKSCTNEYGCNDLNNNDIVYVEGYKDTFRATIYENNLFRYIPI